MKKITLIISLSLILFSCKSKPGQSTAVMAAEHYVENYLSILGATDIDFAALDYNYEDLHNDYYLVVSTVDYLDPTGTTVTMEYKAKLKYIGDDASKFESWLLEDLTQLN